MFINGPHHGAAVYYSSLANDARFPVSRRYAYRHLLGILLGVFWSVSSNLTVEATQNLTDGGGFAVGTSRCSASGLWISSRPRWARTARSSRNAGAGVLSVFNDNVVATGTLMILFFGTILALLGKDLMVELDKSAATGSFGFYIIRIAFTFAVYLSILQLGVRMFVAELTESFTGISEKLLPGSMPAVDCAATYGFGHPNAVTFGFLFARRRPVPGDIGPGVFKSPILIITGFVLCSSIMVHSRCSPIRKAALKRSRAHILLGHTAGARRAVCASIFQTAQFGGWHGNFDMDTIGSSAASCSSMASGLALRSAWSYCSLSRSFSIGRIRRTTSHCEDYDAYKSKVAAN